MKVLYSAIFAIVISSTSLASVLHVEPFTSTKPVVRLSNGLTVYSIGFAATLDGNSIGPVFCVDMEGRVLPPDTYQVEVLSSGQIGYGNPGLAAALYNTYAPGLQGIASDQARAQEAGALQLAIWEAEYETGQIKCVSNNAGTFYASSGSASMIARANEMLANVGSDPSVAQYYKSTTSETHYGQGMIGNPIPEAASLILMGFAILGAFPITRRRRRGA